MTPTMIESIDCGLFRQTVEEENQPALLRLGVTDFQFLPDSAAEEARGAAIINAAGKASGRRMRIGPGSLNGIMARFLSTTRGIQ
jgi:hypothetical protein